MATETEIKARLTLDAKQAQAQARSYQQSLGNLQQKIRGTQSATGGLIKQTLALGAAYFGISTGVRVFKSLTGSAIKYTADLEKTKIGLTSVMSAVNEVPWERGVKQAEAAFSILKKMSITSPAGPQDMFNIFQGIVGPLRAAGTEMDRIYAITNDTVLASSALGVDFEQAQRDISLMARGAAGMDTKLFSLLRSTGAIAESTEEWNRGLSDTERVAKLEVALKKFAGSGDAFGNSWAGLTSTFKGIVDELKRAAATPVMAAMQENLKKFNNTLIANRVHLESLMKSYGMRVAEWINVAADASVKGFKYLQENWASITAKFDQAMSVLKKYGPMLAKVAGVSMAADMARGPLAGAVGAAGAIAPGLMAGGKAVGGKVGGFLGAFRGLGEFGAGEFGATAGLAASVAGGSGVAAGGAGAAAGAGGAGAAGAAAGVALAPIVAILASMAAVALAVKANWDPLVAFLGGDLASAGDTAMGIFSDLWGVVGPLLESVGTIMLSVLAPALKMLLVSFEFLAGILRPILQVLGGLARLLAGVLRAGFEWLMDNLSFLADKLSPITEYASNAGSALMFLAETFGAFVDNTLADAARMRQEAAQARFDAQEAGWAPMGKDYNASKIASDAMALTMAANDSFLKDSKTGGAKKKVPGGRGGSTVNVQKMIIKQDFKNADPARIVTQMIGDITRQAENRVQTRYQGALTR